MKKILLILALLILLPFEVGWADFLGIKQASEFIAARILTPLDSLYGIPRAPDSIHILTYADNGSAAAFVTRSTTAPFSDISIDTLNYSGSVSYVLVDQIQDIDGAGGNIQLSIEIKTWYDDVATSTFHSVQVISDSLNTVGDSAILAATALKPTTAGRALDVTAAGEAGLDLDNTTGTFSKTEIPALTYFDTLIYIGEHGLGIFVDSTAGNTNTVIGVDGTENNPVSTLAAGRTLGLALGAHRLYLHGGSTFNGAGTDLAADYSEWEFYGEGHGIEIAFGGQLVTNSFFHNVTLSGAMHASGGDVLFEDCELGFISANFNGKANNCWLSDTIVLKVSKDILFSDCQSSVSGNKTPTIDMTGGSSTISMTGYSGGIRVMSGSSNDTISVQTDGQVIISANNTSLNITIRGMLTPTDSGTTTNLTKDAVFSRSEADLWVWSNVDTTRSVDTSDIGDWLSTGIGATISGQNIADIADSILGHVDTGWTASTPGGKINAIRSYMDTLIYAGKVWLDAAAANTNTVVGTDGTRSNPVSTIAAATTIATSLGIQAIYLANSSSITLAQTYNGWEFVGVGINNTINFGSQDLDRSSFVSLTVTGIQGGTELIYMADCGISGADSLEVFAENCWLTGNNSVKLATNICFNQCKSAVAGSSTPQLNFASAAAAIDVNFRHYSGGLEVLNMTSNHTISFEADGQFIINANCTSAQIALRGNIFVTNNGTTTNFLQNKDAVFSRQEAEFWVWSNADTTQVDSSDIGAWLSNNLGTATDVNMTQISGDATAADNLEAILDGTGGTPLDISQLHIQTAQNGTGILIDASVGFPDVAIELKGDTGLSTISGTYGMTIQGSLMGMDIQGDTAIRAVGSGNNDIIGTMSKVIDLGANGEIGRVIANTIGTIDGATPSTTGFSATELTQGDDYWNNQMILILTGSTAGQTARITDFTAATDSITFTPAMSVTLAQNDSFVILGLFAEAASAVVSQANMAEIADSVWGKDTTGLLTAGRYGLEATTGGAASVSDAAISLMMDSMSLRGHITYDSNGVLQLSGLYIIATPGGESTAVELQGDGAGHALYAHGDLAANAGNTGYGVYFRSAFNGLYGGLFDAVPASGIGLGATGPGATGVGFKIEGGLYGLEIFSRAYAGHGMYVHADSGDGGQYKSSTACDTCSNKHAIEFLGHEGAGSDVIVARANGPSSVAASFWSDDTSGIEIIGSVTSGNGDGMYVSRGTGSGQDIRGTVDTVERVIFVDSTDTVIKQVASLATGSGSNLVRLWAIDSATSAGIPYAWITLYGLDSVSRYAVGTNSNGYVDFNLHLNDSLLWTASAAGFILISLDTVIVTGNIIDSIQLRAIPLPSAGTGDVVAAFIDIGTGIYDTAGNMIPFTDARGILNLMGDDDLILSDSAWFIVPTEYKKPPDANGRITFYVPANTKMTPPGSYYELTLRGISRQPYSAQRKIRFVLDTLPDPINILNATRVP